MSSGLTPSQRSLRARIGAYALHAARDARETTAKVRAALTAKFERQVDPTVVLPPEERRRRAESARRAHMARLALRSSQSRKTRTAEARDPGRSKGATADVTPTGTG